MPSRDFFLEQIARELAVARQASQLGQDGKARVAARRAAGVAIGWFLQESPRPEWGGDALTRLRHAAGEASFPPEVCAAATRLTTKITDRFRYPFSTDPVADAALIVTFIFPGE